MHLTGHHLSVSRGGRRIFDGLSFALSSGEFVAVTGANGAGKSTLLRSVAGLLRPDEGSIILDPEPEAGRAVAIHYLGHLDGLKPRLTVHENLLFWRRLWQVGAPPDPWPAGLASRRAGDLARCLRRGDARAARGGASRRWRHGDGRAAPVAAAGTVPLDRPRAGRGMIAAFGTIAGQTARLSLRSGGGPLIGLVFFLAVVTIVPFGVGPDLKLLARIGPAILWIGALLATLLGLDRLFQDDRDDGSLDLLMLAGPPLEIVVLAKCLGHWLATGLPLVIAAPVLGLLLGVEPAGLGAVTLTLLAGSPGLTLIGAIGAALLTALGRGGLLVAVLVLPFTIPVLIFGVSSTAAVLLSGSFLPPFLILIAITLVSMVVATVAGAAALRAGMD